MATAHLSLEEYLRTDYEPDCDYLDGQLEERNAGELDHSIALAFFVGSFAAQRGAIQFRSLSSAPAPCLADADSCCRHRRVSSEDAL